MERLQEQKAPQSPRPNTANINRVAGRQNSQSSQVNSINQSSQLEIEESEEARKRVSEHPASCILHQAQATVLGARAWSWRISTSHSIPGG